MNIFELFRRNSYVWFREGVSKSYNPYKRREGIRKRHKLLYVICAQPPGRVATSK